MPTYQNLLNNTAIVDPNTGRPTDYFMRLLQERGLGQTNTDKTLAVLQQTIAGKADKTIHISAGAGLTGGGDLSADRTISADVQAILDSISSTRGAILYRGAAGWAALAPGTSGQALVTQGVGADPKWDTVASSGGGGSGALTLVQSTTCVGTEAFVEVVIPAGAKDIEISFSGTAAAASGLYCYLNGDTTPANYNTDRWNHYGHALGANAYVADIAAGLPIAATIVIPGYAGTTFNKTFNTVSTYKAAADNFPQLSATTWANTAAVTKVRLAVAGTTFAAGTTINVYVKGTAGGTSSAAASKLADAMAQTFIPTFNSWTAVLPGGASLTTTYNITPSNTTVLGRIPRLGVGGALGANGYSQVRGQQTFYIGGAMEMVIEFGFENVASTARIVAGMQAGWSGGTDISAATNFVCIGKDAADANLQFISRASGAVTKIDLGANFPGSGSGMYYRATLTSDGNGVVTYKVERLDSAFTAAGTVNTNLPPLTQNMYGGMWFAASVAATVQGSIIGFYCKPTLSV